MDFSFALGEKRTPRASTQNWGIGRAAAEVQRGRSVVMGHKKNGSFSIMGEEA